MRRIVKVLSAGLVAVLASSVVASAAQASKRVVLRSGGQVVAAGTGAGGTLRFGPCGTFTSTGTLTNNEARIDTATFTTFEEGLGGCGEGGPIISGQLESMQMSGNGTFAANGTLSYKTSIPMNCEYSLTRLRGKLELPAATATEVSGRGRRVKAGSEPGCRGTIRVSGVEAKLYDIGSGEPFEAEAASP